MVGPAGAGTGTRGGPDTVDPPTNRDLGRAIRVLRKERRLTIEGLAFEANMSPTYVSKVERGRCNPSWMMVGSLARALQVTVADVAVRAERAARVRKGFERVLAEEEEDAL
jgi:transcriptional regulator with XRE-family HTH domain